MSPLFSHAVVEQQSRHGPVVDDLGPVRCNSLPSGDKAQQAVPGMGLENHAVYHLGIPVIHKEMGTAVKRGKHGNSSAF